MDPLSVFSPATRAWFERTFEGPTPPQVQGWPAIAVGRARADPGADRLGQDAHRVPLRDRQADRHARRGAARPLRLAAEGAELRHRAEPARPARRARVEAPRRGAHRRHAAEGAPRAPQGAARHPDHDARVALPDAHLAGTRDAARRRDADPRRGARRRRHEARRAHGDQRRAARSAVRHAAAADRAVRDAAAARGDRALRLRRARDRARRRGDAQGARPRGGRARSRTCASSARPRRSPSRSPTPASQSIWPSIYPEMLRLVREHRSTIVFVNNRRLAERLALRLNELAEEEIARAHHGSLAREQRRSSRRS